MPGIKPKWPDENKIRVVDKRMEFRMGFGKNGSEFYL